MTHESPATDLAILESMVNRLEAYLEDDRLFKTITAYTPAGEQLVKLTIGAILERLDELKQRSDLSDEERQKLTTLAERVAAVKRRRPEAFYRKLAREVNSYADSWRWFLQSCEEGDRRCVQDYPFEVATRLRIQRLLDEGEGRPELEAARNRVAELDRRLRRIWKPGAFVLRGQSPGKYPADRYWWLYGHPDIKAT